MLMVSINESMSFYVRVQFNKVFTSISTYPLIIIYTVDRQAVMIIPVCI